LKYILLQYKYLKVVSLNTSIYYIVFYFYIHNKVLDNILKA